MSEKTIPFEIQHLDLMEIRDIEIASAFCLPDAKERMQAMIDTDLADGTFILDGRIIFAAGVFQLWPGVLNGWIIPTIYVPDYPIWFVKKVKCYFESLAKAFECHRFQTVSPEDEMHQKWMEMLGFQKEGVHRQYSHNKKDYGIYARIFSWQ
jgi:hypothetical protein